MKTSSTPSSLTRRDFLGETSCALIGSTSVMSSLLSLQLAEKAAADGLTAGDDCKTIVSIMLAGGIDSFNVLVPNDDQHANYSAARGGVGNGGMALDKNSLEGLTGMGFGLHPSCPELADMFNGTGDFQGDAKLSFVANIGTLLRPTSINDYRSGNHPLPKALFSHIDQITQWQTSMPESPTQLTGWAGRMADLLHSSFNTQQISMSISLAGNNSFQIGNNTSQFAITQNGALLPISGNRAANLKNVALDSLVGETYRNVMQDALAEHTKDSIEAQRAFGAEYNRVNEVVNGVNVAAFFPSSSFGQQLRATARTIAARQNLGLRRSTIFLQRGGWDHHGELLNTQAGMLLDLSQSLSAFQRALKVYGVDQDVVTYTSSDFGRTLRTNGRGTDHAWGGNQMVMGGSVDAGKIVGTFPTLDLDGPDDVGKGGRILPSTSTDEFFAEMAAWFGVGNTAMAAVLPNLHHFHNISQNRRPLGFIKESAMPPVS